MYIIDKINSFREFKDNWNGYGAEPLSNIVIDRALDLAKQLNPTPEVFPTGRNSIQFEWESDILYLELEVFEDRIDIFNEIKSIFTQWNRYFICQTWIKNVVIATCVEL